MSKSTLQTGDIAPDFTLPDSQGKLVRLYDLLQRGPAVLIFYVKSFTPVCTAEVCGFRDARLDFERQQGTVVGISPDTRGLTAKFAEAHGLNFPLLVDELGEVRQLYRVPKLLGLFPGRATYVVSKDLRLESVTTAAFRSSLHVAESLSSLTKQV